MLISISFASDNFTFIIRCQSVNVDCTMKVLLSLLAINILPFIDRDADGVTAGTAKSKLSQVLYQMVKSFCEQKD